jgi:putative FmdB family regulatory protein
MPVYEYRCKTCGRTHEIEHGFNDERPSKCPSCGGVLVRVFSPVGVVFKGSGFHKTDYARSGARKEPAATADAAKTDGSTKPAAADSKSPADKPKPPDTAKTS